LKLRTNVFLTLPSVLMAPACALFLTLVSGCQRYERAPLDLTAHRASFLERSAQHADVRTFAATLSFSESSPATFDLSDGVDCAEAELIALVFNADLRLARLQAGVARANAENAGLWEDPTLGVDLTRIIQDTPNQWKVFSSIGITIPVSGRLKIEKQKAGIEHAASLARVAELEWATRTEIRRAWITWSSLATQLSTTREFVARVDEVLSIVEKMEQAGEMARTEARLFRIEKATKAAALLGLELSAEQSRLRIKQLMGISPDAPAAFNVRVVASAPGAGARATLDDLEQRNPTVLVAIAEYEAAEKALELEIRKQYPDVHLGPGYGREDGQDQVLLGLSLPLPVLNANRRAIAEAQAKRELARASAEAVLERLINDARSAGARLDTARRLRESLESGIVPLVDDQYADARRVAQLGEVNTLVLLESLSRQQDAKISLIEALRSEALARVDVDAIAGPHTPTRDSTRSDELGTAHQPPTSPAAPNGAPPAR